MYYLTDYTGNLFASGSNIFFSSRNMQHVQELSREHEVERGRRKEKKCFCSNHIYHHQHTRDFGTKRRIKNSITYNRLQSLRTEDGEMKRTHLSISHINFVGSVLQQACAYGLPGMQCVIF